MKWTKYNFLFEVKDSYYIYNSLSNFFAEIDKITFNKLKHLRENLDISNLTKEQIEWFFEKKIIVESEIDEYNKQSFKRIWKGIIIENFL